jgi:hypothetical protein
MQSDATDCIRCRLFHGEDGAGSADDHPVEDLEFADLAHALSGPVHSKGTDLFEK